MKPPLRRWLKRAGIRAVAVGLVIGGATSCSSPAARQMEREARFGPPQPPLEGRTLLLGDSLQVEARLASAMAFGPPGAKGMTPPGRGGMPVGSPPAGMSGGVGGGMPGGGKGMGGGGPSGGGMGGPPPRMEADLPPAMKAQLEAQARGMAIKPPRHILRLEFTNRSKETVEFSVAELSSEIGNFVVRPEHLVLAPGQRVEIDPVLSALEMNFERLPVKLAVKHGTPPRVESCTLVLETVATSKIGEK